MSIRLMYSLPAPPPHKSQAPSISFFRELLDGNSWLRKNGWEILRLKITRDNAARFEQPGLVSESVPEMRFSNVRMAVFEARAERCLKQDAGVLLPKRKCHTVRSTYKHERHQLLQASLED